MALREMAEETDTADEDVAASATFDRFLAACVVGAPTFSALEEEVMRLAAFDSLASLETPGFVERAASMLFGLRPATRALADTRLEALRHAVVVARHRRHLPDRIARNLRVAGFSTPQIRAIEARAIA